MLFAVDDDEPSVFRLRQNLSMLWVPFLSAQSELYLDPEKFIASVLSSPFVNDKLYVSALGGDRKSVDAALLYLKLPVQTRPQISYLFDAKFYLATQPDVEAAGTDPFAHFIQHGCSEARSPHPLIDIKHIIKTDPFLLPASFGTFELYETLVSAQPV
jgi:hypothetical protein